MSKNNISLELEKRETLGKQVRQLRATGVVPAVIHDHGKPSVHVQADGQALYKVFLQAGKHHPVSVQADGKKYTAMIKDVAFEPRKHQLQHVVFNAVKANEKVEAEVPLHAKYDEGNESSPAERNGLMVISHIDVVLVKALPTHLPDALYYDAEKLVGVGDHVTLADVVLPKDVEMDAELTQTIATVYEPSAVAAANDAAGGDADDVDASDVPSDHESNAEEGTQEPEIRPGGKKEAEDQSQAKSPEKQ